MAIPLATTTVEVRHSGGGSTPGVRACITLAGRARGTDRSDEVDEYNLRCDPVLMTRHDMVFDEVTGVEYYVETVAESQIEQFGLRHVVATLRIRKGLMGDDPDNS